MEAKPMAMRASLEHISKQEGKNLLQFVYKDLINKIKFSQDNEELCTSGEPERQGKRGYK